MLRAGLKALPSRNRYRAFSTTSKCLAAKLMAMPAMSPTMTEGGIVDWKVKEGDSFSAGDILLEVETDKAQIDVEAPDDGILAKIFEVNGAKNVAVGSSIAVLADPGDDISTLEIPAPITGNQNGESKEAEPPKEPEAAKEPISEPKSKSAPAAAAAGPKANPNQTLFPSVLTLLHRNNLSSEDALSKITASGPNGRLLKGDVLAFLGAISQDSVNKLTQSIKDRQHLDLSNIKLRDPAQATEQAKEGVKTAPDANATAAPAKAKPQPIVLRRVIELGTIRDLRAEYEQEDATEDIAETARAIAKSLAAPGKLDSKKTALYDPVFEDLIATRAHEKAFSHEISFFTIPSSAPAKPKDIYDILSSPRPAARPVRAASSAEFDTFAVNIGATVNESVPNARSKAEAYLTRVASQIERLKEL